MKIDLKKIKDNAKNTISGDALGKKEVQKYFPLAIFFVLFCIVYISLGYHTHRQMRHLATIEKQIEEAKFENLTLNAQLVEKTRQSQVESKLREYESNIQISNKPAVKVK